MMYSPRALRALGVFISHKSHLVGVYLLLCIIAIVNNGWKGLDWLTHIISKSEELLYGFALSYILIV